MGMDLSIDKVKETIISKTVWFEGKHIELFSKDFQKYLVP